MEKLIDKFLRYVSVETTSDENSESQPSTAKQLNLLRMLRDELQAMGIEATLDEYGYVMATIPSNVNRDIPSIGFIAHVDTSPDASGADIKPQIIPNYDGNDIVLFTLPKLKIGKKIITVYLQQGGNNSTLSGTSKSSKREIGFQLTHTVKHSQKRLWSSEPYEM